jgi:hypothetical protein
MILLLFWVDDGREIYHFGRSGNLVVISLGDSVINT